MGTWDRFSELKYKSNGCNNKGYTNVASIISMLCSFKEVRPTFNTSSNSSSSSCTSATVSFSAFVSRFLFVSAFACSIFESRTLVPPSFCRTPSRSISISRISSSMVPHSWASLVNIGDTNASTRRGEQTCCAIASLSRRGRAVAWRTPSGDEPLPSILASNDSPMLTVASLNVFRQIFIAVTLTNESWCAAQYSRARAYKGNSTSTVLIWTGLLILLLEFFCVVFSSSVKEEKFMEEAVSSDLSFG
mmetsp:Transcript_17525/g.25933  ORF Transcript_17525/g.25933 Transcript_17525/m.25933 type:complete len:247 (+) Transcript_17525:2125-2865(+)